MAASIVRRDRLLADDLAIALDHYLGSFADRPERMLRLAALLRELTARLRTVELEGQAPGRDELARPPLLSA